jgi:hypothetical protein
VGVQEELRERREEKGKRKGERGKKFAIRTGITGLIKYQRCNACSCFPFPHFVKFSQIHHRL